MTRFTASLFCTVESITGSKRPDVKSLISLVAPRSRSIAFGVNTMSGRRGRA
jgi:hypothetical protein